MKVGDKILDLHGITYEIMEVYGFHTMYPHPHLMGVMTRDTLSDQSINIHATELGDYIGVYYNQGLRLYVNILLKMLDYNPEKDIRNGYKNITEQRRVKASKGSRNDTSYESISSSPNGRKTKGKK